MELILVQVSIFKKTWKLSPQLPHTWCKGNDEVEQTPGHDDDVEDGDEGGVDHRSKAHAFTERRVLKKIFFIKY